MITVSDMKRSIEFYRDKLGIPLRYESPEWSEFETGATKLALHGGGKPKDHSQGRRETPAGDCSIGFEVDDLDKAYQELKSKGVNFVMPPSKREGEPIKLSLCLDPDGLVISIAEPSRQSW